MEFLFGVSESNTLQYFTEEVSVLHEEHIISFLLVF